MMIKRIYSKYFQKSRSFLYPALGIKKNDKFKPTNTYISIKGLIEPEDVKLICTFDKEETEAFKYFETKMLLENPLFSEKIIVDDCNIYIFDYEIYANDWFNFILGKYSKLSNVLKRAIKTFYGENSSEYEYIHSYLNPKDYFREYSEMLDVDIEILQLSGELCDPCDLEKETLKISIENLQSLKKTI
jgi:hypothetical protein